MEPATPDLVDRYRRTIEAANRGDLDAVMSFWGPDPVWDTSPAGMGMFEGPAAVRGFFEDWVSSYEAYEIEAEEIADLGNGVTYAIVLQRGRPAGSNSEVRVRSATVGLWVNGQLTRVTNYPDIDAARADAERLAAERG
jgi:ketosteroid isomerase-like protein